MDGDRVTRAARYAPFTWWRLVLATGLGLSLTLSPDTMAEDEALGAVQAAPLVAEADLHVSLGASDWRAGPAEGFSYHVTVTNGGNAAAPALVETVLPPALTNVTVAASGLSCTRQFEAAGSQPGTAVTCTSWEPLDPGASASFTVRARAATSPGIYRIVARATEDGESGEDSRASVELRVGQ